MLRKRKFRELKNQHYMSQNGLWNDFRTGPYFIMHAEYINYSFALLFSRTMCIPKGIEYIHG